MPNGTQTRAAQPEDITLYNRDGVCVTSRVLIAGNRRYEIRVLRQLMTARGRRNPIHVHAGMVAGVLCVAIVATAVHVGTVAWIAAGAASALPCAVLALSAVAAARPYQLWCEIHGEPVILLSISDGERYHQIVRALIRAKERAIR
jgi:hypothetical protein